MEEDFQAGVCGSTWWSSTRGTIGFSPCLLGVNHDNGSFGWPSHDLMELKAISSNSTKDVSNSIYPNQGSFVFDQFMQKPSTEAPLIDSTLIKMDSSCSSTKTEWSQNLISGSGSDETSCKSGMVQENMSSTLNELKQTSSTQAFPIQSSLPMSSASYSYPSTLIENLFDDDQLPLENQTMNFPSTTSYQTNLNEFSSSLMKSPSPLSPPPQPRQEIPPSHLMDSNHFWNGSNAVPNDRRASLFFSAQLVEKSNLHKLKRKSNNRAVQDSNKRSTEEPAVKRSRIETPSTLPTFKVRKEKLGDRITALQQLVSPFGKTDTASVLQEAIEYIKFLHDQVNVLSTPFLKNGASIQHQENFDIQMEHENQNQDLRGRGLCLVPISSTFPVATETTVDFWTPTFGRTFR